jgi:hypothetical protein
MTAKTPQNIIAVELRQTQIQYEQIEYRLPQGVIRVLAAANAVDRIPGLNKAELESLPQGGIVFGNQDPQGFLPCDSPHSVLEIAAMQQLHDRIL